MHAPTIIHHPAPPTRPGSSRRPRYLVFLITGNPGLIGYYAPFLAHLHARLNNLPLPYPADANPASPSSSSSSSSSSSTDTRPSPAFELFGRSLSGFEAAGAEPGAFPAATATASGASVLASSVGAEAFGSAPPFSLRAQIAGVEWVLRDHVRGMREQWREEAREAERTRGGEDEGKAEEQQQQQQEPQVILIGHSVGAYIALELTRRWRERARLRRTRHTTAAASSSSDENQDADTDAPPTLAGTIHLFPTITHIALSPSGQRLSTLYALLPPLAHVAHLLAQALTLLLPASWLLLLVRGLTRMPPGPAGTTAAFLASRFGVLQALGMARDELREIGEDEWGRDVWGAAGGEGEGEGEPDAQGEPEEGAVERRAREPPARLFFLFGRGDHWVADSTRDELVEARGRRAGRDEKWRPVMEVDETGIPHGFCTELGTSITVAERVKHYIDEIVEDVDGARV